MTDLKSEMDSERLSAYILIDTDFENKNGFKGFDSTRAHICHEYHELYSWRQNMSREEISAFHV